ncbi:MAG: ABC transporter substrate-binding protein [Alphaproteobacteria bacterium]|nr:ABC transporter substrate-binding protein [Alphaproteobacteria bacterium]
MTVSLSRSFNRAASRLARATVVASGLVLASTFAASAQQVTVAVTSIVEHPALNAVRDGIKDSLEKAGYTEGDNLEFVFETAQGQPAIAKQIADQFVGEEADVLVGISTPSAQALISTGTQIPIVFSAVTDPVGAGIVPTMDPAGGNVVGISDLSPVAAQIALIGKLVPDVKSIGIVANPGEDNSRTLVALARAAALEQGFEIYVAAANSTSQVYQATQFLVDRVDAIYVPTDNTAAAAIESLISVANSRKIPVISAETSQVEAGALAAAGFNYYDVGVETGDLVVSILNGANPGELASSTVQRTELYLNARAASALGITLSDDVLASAKEVIR